MSDYRKLKVWDKAHRIAREVHRLADGLPAEEQIGLAEEVRRTAGRMVFPLAEGCARRDGRQFARAIGQAGKQRAELAQLLMIVRDLSLLSAERYRDLENELSALAPMLWGLRARLSANGRGSRTRAPAPATPRSSA